MKAVIVFLIIISSSIGSVVAQTTQYSASELMSLGESSLKQKEYMTARYSYKRAYNAYAAQGDYTKAVECGIQAAALYTRENYYTEAFNLFQNMEYLISTGETKLNKPLYNLQFAVTNERLQVYSRMKAAERAKSTLSKLEEIAAQAKNDSLDRVKLYSEADYYYAFGMNAQGNASIQKLINKFKENKEYDKASEVYREIIEKAKEKNNTLLASLAYERYMLWTDSVKDLKAKDELDMQIKKYDDSLRTIGEKDDALSSRMYIIVGLCILSAILAGALVFLAIVLLRFMARNRTLKKGIQTANEHNELKSEFIRNISGQMEPTLNAISESAGGIMDEVPEHAAQIQGQVGALQKFCDNIQELSALENSLAESYETEDVDVNLLCQRSMDTIREYVKPEISITVNAPSLKIKTNQEQVERILQHLLMNAAQHTEKGYIILDFKRRGARIYQFVVTDSGSGVPQELRENLFRPFTEVRNLTDGDGLGLPICSLIATKMSGSLTLDETYNKGSRFVLELRS
ncbi:sensor histidine kinase [Dysgonomonas sp. 521]|uniref:ATP-binding protein n=1 Tax=Dysgonomonas sp. 521 TaxID=2302932 RepID=UPI0013D42AEE|nr:ATP-binding protein [Dysgonomonas sp. 521]NDV95436.1 sensor histidine kinase [Dysgonomonas sp. 521]